MSEPYKDEHLITTILGSRARIDFTPGELRAMFSALDSYLNAADDEEQRVIFGSPSGVRAAIRAKKKIVQAQILLGNRA